jgi:hypothetical protein
MTRDIVVVAAARAAIGTFGGGQGIAAIFERA